jgi:two-component system nitrate/nitrite response regulator NarL
MDDRQKLSILLLEDQRLVCAGMRALIHISEPTAQIEQAASFDEAVALIETMCFDFAFLDIDLKDQKSGLDVLRYIRSRGIDTRAIMLSAYAGRDIVMECIAAGASGYILKDMESDGVFRRALDTILQGVIFLPANVIGRGNSSLPNAGVPIAAESLGVHGRALEVLYYLCQGLQNKEIADKMKIEESTVRKDYVPKLFRLFQVARRIELLIEVSRRGIVIPTPEAVFRQRTTSNFGQ